VTVRSALIALALAAGAAAPALGHHSFAMFDREHKRQISGTVKEVQWTNPHVWIQVDVPNGKGGVDEWGVECTSVNFMTRRGWDKDTVKAGDRIALNIYPLKDGSHGGGFADVVSLNGKPLVLEPEE
jgi:hypothetical protein